MESKWRHEFAEEFCHFTAHENGAILGASVRGSMRSGWLVGLVHDTWQQRSDFEVTITLMHSGRLAFASSTDPF